MIFAVTTWMIGALVFGFISRVKLLGGGIRFVCSVLSALFFVASLATLSVAILVRMIW